MPVREMKLYQMEVVGMPGNYGEEGLRNKGIGNLTIKLINWTIMLWLNLSA
jgi:hypothetical protein